ncbi:OmpA family protein [Saprospiraceae bacterium]|nr:OmpA family protein [Saprospiraceae bacterium]
MNKFLLFISLLFVGNLSAQEKMEVIRCTASELQDPVQNIFTDKDNNKWVGNRNALFQVHAIDYATPINLASDEESLLRLPNGNADLKWSKSQMDVILDGESVSAAFYDTKSRELWIGTETSGIYRLKVGSKLELLGTIDNKNSKLKSNHINCITKDREGRFWIGTEEGALVGQLGKWKLQEKLFNVEAIDINRGYIWIMGDDFVWQVEEDEWYPIDIEERYLEGHIKDIAADSRGKLWIASEVVVRYTPDSESFEYFGPAQYFTSQNVNCVAIDKDDALWVGTQDKGLFVIKKAAAITVICQVEKSLSCDFSSPDGALKVTVSGGQPPYEYNWSGNLRGNNPKNLGPGEYKVTVTDSQGKENTGKIAIPDPRFSLNITAEKAESGAGLADGVAKISIDGGTQPFSFKWDNGENTQTARKLTEGVHVVTVTDKNGCIATGSIDVSQILAPLEITFNQTQENNCHGDANAQLEVSVSGGKAPYYYTWDKSGLVGKKLIKLAAGAYMVTVKDAVGTVSMAQVAINEPPTLNATLKVDAPASTGNSDGKATVQASGGTGDYSYKWDNGETTPSASKLNPGNHTVTISDSQGCESITEVTIPENILTMSASINLTTDIKCNGERSASIKTNVSGGKAPFKYQWSDARLNGENPSNLNAGNYSLTITDVAGNSATSNIQITEPEVINISITPQNPATTGNTDGKARAKVTGGTGGYMFKWDNGETDKTAEKLNAGTHTLTVTDKNGCQAIATIDITENILPLAVSLEQIKSINCNGEQNAELKSEISGGKAPFTYSWNDSKISSDKALNLAAGNYELIVTDVTGTTANAKIIVNQPEALSANIQVEKAATLGQNDGKARINAKGGNGNYAYKWDNGETTKTAEKLSSGEHSVTITDENGCQTTSTIDISENILPLSVNLNQVKNINCNGEKSAELTVEIEGGKPPFSYNWNDANISGENAKGLAAGNYGLTLTDATGTTTTSKILVDQPDALSANIQIEKPASTGNSDGKARISVKGGDGNYSYKWDNGETEEIASKLSPGNRTVTVTDGNGCSIIESIEILENILAMTIEIEQTGDVNCFGDANAAVQVSVSGGKGPFNYQWNDSNLSGENPSSLKAGDYEVSVTDVTGKTETKKVSISQPAQLTARVYNIQPASEQDSQDGEATVIAEGGVGSFLYKWSNGETEETAKKLPIGNHSITVTDGNGCEANTTLEIKKKLIPELTAGRLRLGQAIRLDGLNFDADSTVLNDTSLPVLDEIFYFMEQNPEIEIEIGGHTNGIPPHEYCDQLSSERSKNIMGYIVQKGIDSSRISSKGYGKRNPIASNKTANGRRRNQRVELKVLKLSNG